MGCSVFNTFKDFMTTVCQSQLYGCSMLQLHGCDSITQEVAQITIMETKW